MKKLSVIILIVMMALGAQAQVKVTPKLQKGLEAVYKSNMKLSMPGTKGDIVANSTTRYTIVGETADGYELETMMTDFDTNVADDDVPGQLMMMSMSLIKGVKSIVLLDKNGRPIGLKNFDELHELSAKACDQAIAKLLEKMPEIAQMIPTDMLKQQVMESLTEKATVDMLCNNGVLALNGRTIMTGAQEEYTNEQGMKMKRMYLLMGTDGKKIRTSGTLNMTKDEMKQLFIDQIEATMPDQAEAVKQNIDMLMESGMLKMDITDTTDFTLRDDQWVQTLTTNAKSNTMGQESTVETTTEFVSGNF